MASPGDLLPIVVAAVVFPIVFAGFWSLVCWILASISGYRSLRSFGIDRAQAVRAHKLATPWFAMIGVVSYRGGVLGLRSSSAGLVILIARIFPFHPPICVPWESIEEATGVGFFGFLTGGGVLLLDGRVRLRVPTAAYEAIRAASRSVRSQEPQTA